MGRVVLLVIATAAAMACDQILVEPSDVAGRTWQLVSIQRDGAGPVTVGNPSQYTLRLEEDGRVAVRSDCNSCGGSYSMSGSALDLGPITCTRVFCGDASLDQEYVRALEGRTTVSASESDMTIRGNGVTLRFRR